jgi:uncharacterized protein YdbL (DUF1318 family)
MRLALVIVVALVGILVTMLAAARMWRATQAGAPREQVLGYVAIMLVASVLSLLVLRAL